MSFEEYKIQNYATGVSSLPDYPSDEGYTAQALKEVFDARSDKEIKEKHNALVDAVSEIADGGTEHEENTENPHGVTAEQAGAEPSGSIAAHDGSVAAHADIRESIRLHEEDTGNPHGVTAAQIGLSDVDNTSDADKPVSTATAAALEKLREEATEYVDEVASEKADAVKFSTEKAKTHAIYDSMEGPVISLNMYGESTPTENPTVRVYGKNLLPTKPSGNTQSGVAWNIAEDGRITASGTAAGYSTCKISGGFFLEAGTYTISIKGIAQNVKLETTTLSPVNGKQLPQTFTLSEAGTHIVNLTRVGNGEVEVDGYMQIEAGSKATEYEPYVSPQTVTIPYTLGSGDTVTLSDGVVKAQISGTETDITETEEGKALLALHTNYPNTSIFCDAPCRVRYVADTENAYKNLLRRVEALENA